jgi:hypothetical protein
VEEGLPVWLEPVGTDATIVGETLGPDANGTTVGEILDPDANGATVGETLDPDANGTTVDQILAPDANGTTVDEILGTDVNGTTVDEILAPDANGTTVDEILGPDANGTTVGEIVGTDVAIVLPDGIYVSLDWLWICVQYTNTKIIIWNTLLSIAINREKYSSSYKMKFFLFEQMVVYFFSLPFSFPTND